MGKILFWAFSDLFEIGDFENSCFGLLVKMMRTFERFWWHLEIFGLACRKIPRRIVFLVRGGAFMGVWLSWWEWARHKFAQICCDVILKKTQIFNFCLCSCRKHKILPYVSGFVKIFSCICRGGVGKFARKCLFCWGHAGLVVLLFLCCFLHLALSLSCFCQFVLGFWGVWGGVFWFGFCFLVLRMVWFLYFLVSRLRQTCLSETLSKKMFFWVYFVCLSSFLLRLPLSLSFSFLFSFFLVFFVVSVAVLYLGFHEQRQNIRLERFLSSMLFVSLFRKGHPPDPWTFNILVA